MQPDLWMDDRAHSLAPVRAQRDSDNHSLHEKDCGQDNHLTGATINLPGCPPNAASASCPQQSGDSPGVTLAHVPEHSARPWAGSGWWQRFGDGHCGLREEGQGSSAQQGLFSSVWGGNISLEAPAPALNTRGHLMLQD